jgi:hypothetical protein
VPNDAKRPEPDLGDDEVVETVEADMEADGEVESEVDVVGAVVVEFEVDVEEPVADDLAAEEPVGPDDEAEAEAVDVADDMADDMTDDVVVDLFARLRAETADEESEPTVDAVEAVETVEVVEEPSAFERRDADLTPLIVGAARKLKRVLADEQNELLERLRTNVPVTELAALLPPEADHVARYATSIHDELERATDAGAALMGRSDPLPTEQSAVAVGAAEGVLVEWLVAPLRERLERCVAEGEGDNAGISKRIRAVYREWKTQHIDEHLDDIVRTAHGAGAFAAVEPGHAVTWVCDPAHRGCADCDDNALGGAVAAGTAFPTGHAYAPAHIGCRCLLLPDGR